MKRTNILDKSIAAQLNTILPISMFDAAPTGTDTPPPETTQTASNNTGPDTQSPPPETSSSTSETSATDQPEATESDGNDDEQDDEGDDNPDPESEPGEDTETTADESDEVPDVDDESAPTDTESTNTPPTEPSDSESPDTTSDTTTTTNENTDTNDDVDTDTASDVDESVPTDEDVDDNESEAPAEDTEPQDTENNSDDEENSSNDQNENVEDNGNIDERTPVIDEITTQAMLGHIPAPDVLNTTAVLNMHSGISDYGLNHLYGENPMKPDPWINSRPLPGDFDDWFITNTAESVNTDLFNNFLPDPSHSDALALLDGISSDNLLDGIPDQALLDQYNQFDNQVYSSEWLSLVAPVPIVTTGAMSTTDRKLGSVSNLTGVVSSDRGTVGPSGSYDGQPYGDDGIDFNIPYGDDGIFITDSGDPLPEGEVSMAVDDEEVMLSVLPDTSPPVELVVINNDGLRDMSEVIEGELAAGREVLMINGYEDGIAKINAYLDSQPDDKAYDGIIVYSHGDDNQIQLGNATLNDANIGDSGIDGLSDHLSADADIIFAACDVAATDDGKALIDQIAALTGADVGASTDDTGNQDNGDWVLEYQAGGDVTTEFSTEVQENYEGENFALTVDPLLLTGVVGTVSDFDTFVNPVDGKTYGVVLIRTPGGVPIDFTQAEPIIDGMTYDGQDVWFGAPTSPIEYTTMQNMVTGSTTNISNTWLGYSDSASEDNFIIVDGPNAGQQVWTGDISSQIFDAGDNAFYNTNPGSADAGFGFLNGEFIAGEPENLVRTPTPEGEDYIVMFGPGHHNTSYTGQLNDWDDNIDGTSVQGSFVNSYFVVFEIPNDPPVLQNNSQDCVPTGTNTLITAATILANDSDPDGDTLSLVPGSGSVGGVSYTITAAGVTVNPPLGTTGSIQITVPTTDGTDVVNQTLTLEFNNDPVATDNAYTAATFAAAQAGLNFNVVTDNTGSGVDSDLDGDSIIVDSFTQPTPAGASVAVAANGSTTFTATDPGSYSFTYTIIDDCGEADTATVTVTIPSPPVIDPDPDTPGNGELGCLAVYVENDGPTPIAPDLNISDDDSANMTALNVVFDSAWETTDSITVDDSNLPAGVTVTVNTAPDGTPTGVSITGTATIAEYEAIAQSISFESSSENPSETDRGVSWEVFDDTSPVPQVSTTATSLVCVDAVPEPPVITPPTPEIPGDPNDPTDPGCTVVYTENDPPTLIAGDISFSDIDSLDLTSAQINFTAGFEATDEITWDETVVPMGVTVTLIGATDGTPIGLSIDGAASLVEYEAIAQSIAYASTSEQPSETLREITWQVFDDTPDEDNADHETSPEEGPLASNIVTTTICVDAVPDPPVITPPTPEIPGDPTDPNDPGCTVVYIENDPATLIASDIVFSDLDSQQLTRATIDFSGEGWEATDIITWDKSLVPDTMIITPVYNTEGVIASLNIDVLGFEDIEVFQAVAQSLSYESSSENPNEGERLLTWQIFDDTINEDDGSYENHPEDGPLPSNVVITSVCVDAVPEPPVIDNLYPPPGDPEIPIDPINPNPYPTDPDCPCDVIYVENANAVALMPLIDFSDIDSLDLTSATIDFSGAGWEPTDVISWDKEIIPEGVTVTPIKAPDGTPLGISIQGDATLEEYEAIVQSISYASTSERPSEEPRTIEVQVFDDTPDEDNADHETSPEEGPLASNIITINLCVDAVPDPPVVELNPNDLPCTTVIAGQGHTPIMPQATITDIDSDNLTEMVVEFDFGNGDGIRYDKSLVPDGVTVDIAFDPTGTITYTISGTASVEEYEAILQSFEVQNTNPAGAGSHELGIRVTVYDDTPVEENSCYETNPENGGVGTAELGVLTHSDTHCISVVIPPPPFVAAATPPPSPLPQAPPPVIENAAIFRHVEPEELEIVEEKVALIDEQTPTHIFIHALVNGHDAVLESQYDENFVQDQVVQNTLKDAQVISIEMNNAIEQAKSVGIDMQLLSEEMDGHDAHQVVTELDQMLRLEFALTRTG